MNVSCLGQLRAMKMQVLGLLVQVQSKLLMEVVVERERK